MDFRFSEEHELFRRAIRDFAEKEIAPLMEEAEEKGAFPRQLLPKMGRLGYLGMPYPEKYGGSGADMMSMCIWTEEIGKVNAGIASALMTSMGPACMPIYLFGSEEQRQKYLVPAIKGDALAAFALTEPNAGSDVARIQTTARRDGDDYVLNGSKMFITGAPISDFMMVAAYTRKDLGPRGISLLVVENKTPGCGVTNLKKVGCLSVELGAVAFEDCRVPRENLVGEEIGGFDKLVATLYRGRITHAARSVGVARAAYEAALKYAQERVAFGQPIGRFQAIRFKLAEVAIDIDAAHLLTYRAAWLCDQNMPCVKEASMAKLFASEMAVRVTGEALQIHGGYGYMMEYPVQRYWRDARQFTITEGTSEIQHTIIARQIGL